MANLITSPLPAHCTAGCYPAKGPAWAPDKRACVRVRACVRLCVCVYIFAYLHDISCFRRASDTHAGRWPTMQGYQLCPGECVSAVMCARITGLRGGACAPSCTCRIYCMSKPKQERAAILGTGTGLSTATIGYPVRFLVLAARPCARMCACAPQLLSTSD